MSNLSYNYYSFITHIHRYVITIIITMSTITIIDYLKAIILHNIYFCLDIYIVLILNIYSILFNIAIFKICKIIIEMLETRRSQYKLLKRFQAILKLCMDIVLNHAFVVRYRCISNSIITRINRELNFMLNFIWKIKYCIFLSNIINFSMTIILNIQYFSQLSKNQLFCVLTKKCGIKQF